MDKRKCMIHHLGRIEALTGNMAEISMQQVSACASCHAKNACMSVDTKERRVVVPVDPNNFQLGEEVQVILKTQQGYKAVLFAYILPFIVAFFVLIIGELIGWQEWQSGIMSLVGVAIYFIGLKFFSKKLSLTMSFEVKKITNI